MWLQKIFSDKFSPEVYKNFLRMNDIIYQEPLEKISPAIRKKTLE